MPTWKIDCNYITDIDTGSRDIIWYVYRWNTRETRYIIHNLDNGWIFVSEQQAEKRLLTYIREQKLIKNEAIYYNEEGKIISGGM